MKKFTRLCSTLPTSILVVGLLSTSVALAQDYWVPYSSSGTTTFDSTTGLLRIPSAAMFTNRSAPARMLFDVVLTHVGDDTFRVVSGRDVRPDQECTRAEVLSASTQLSLDMTLAEAEALIGCTAVTSVRGTDLESGRLVEASWVGQDGLPNSGSSNSTRTRTSFSTSSFVSGNVFFVVESSNWAPETGGATTPSGVPIRTFSGNGPGISFLVREGVLESYTFSGESSSQLCEDVVLKLGFASLETGDSLAKIENALGCKSSLVRTTVSKDEVQEHYSWRARPQTFFTSAPTELENSSIEVTLVNGAMTAATKTISTTQFQSFSCSVEEIEAIAEVITVGTAEAALQTLTVCPPRSVSRVDTLASTTSHYSWGSQNNSDSIYLSVNRLLSVSVEEGVVSSVILRRL